MKLKLSFPTYCERCCKKLGGEWEVKFHSNCDDPVTDEHPTQPRTTPPDSPKSMTLKGGKRR